jgi:hypothetical protein
MIAFLSRSTRIRNTNAHPDAGTAERMIITTGQAARHWGCRRGCGSSASINNCQTSLT